MEFGGPRTYATYATYATMGRSLTKHLRSGISEMMLSRNR